MNLQPRDNDLSKLDVSFRERLEELVARMHELGHDATVWEGLRTFERARQLAALGEGVLKSMHCYGVAADIASGRLYRDASDIFWNTLGREAELLGLIWGGRWKSAKKPKGDRPTVQAVWLTDEPHVRAATPEQVAALVRLRLAMDPSERPTVRERSVKPPGPR
jgi:hypothetical protein